MYVKFLIDIMYIYSYVTYANLSENFLSYLNGISKNRYLVGAEDFVARLLPLLRVVNLAEKKTIFVQFFTAVNRYPRKIPRNF
jgi:hypothetical protein